MAFTPTEWHNNTQPAISAEQLNRIEKGIDDAHTEKVNRSGDTVAGPLLVMGEGGLLALFYKFIGPLADIPPDAPISEFVGAEVAGPIDWTNKQVSGQAMEYARLVGLVKPQYSEQYTFHATIENAIRLYVNGEEIIDYWQRALPPGELTGKASLRSDQWSSILIEHANFGGNERLKLEWSSATQTRQPIPASAMKWSLLPYQPITLLSQTVAATKSMQLNSYDVWSKERLTVTNVAPANPIAGQIWIDTSVVLS